MSAQPLQSYMAKSFIPASHPVPAVEVLVNAYRDTCRTSAIVEATASGHTDSAGWYRLALKAPIAPFHACLIVSGAPPAGAPWGDTTLSGATVAFRSGLQPGELSDSTRVDLHLPSP